MKKLLLLLILCVSLSSCVKVIPNSCGVVSGYGTIQCDRWSCYYYLPIRYDNYVTNVSVSEYEWYYYQPGYSYCR
jgi:hypothetical protein